MTEKDTENIVRWRNEAFVRENFIYQKPFTVEGHKHWAETMVNTGRAVQFIICTQEEKPVGSVYLRDIDRTHNKAEYGIFIGEEEALSKGYGSEAAELMIVTHLRSFSFTSCICGCWQGMNGLRKAMSMPALYRKDISGMTSFFREDIRM